VNPSKEKVLREIQAHIALLDAKIAAVAAEQMRLRQEKALWESVSKELSE
jgi:prefoldin subunit 5